MKKLRVVLWVLLSLIVAVIVLVQRDHINGFGGILVASLLCAVAVIAVIVGKLLRPRVHRVIAVHDK